MAGEMRKIKIANFTVAKQNKKTKRNKLSMEIQTYINAKFGGDT